MPCWTGIRTGPEHLLPSQPVHQPLPPPPASHIACVWQSLGLPMSMAVFELSYRYVVTLQRTVALSHFDLMVWIVDTSRHGTCQPRSRYSVSSSGMQV